MARSAVDEQEEDERKGDQLGDHDHEGDSDSGDEVGPQLDVEKVRKIQEAKVTLRGWHPGGQQVEGGNKMSPARGRLSGREARGWSYLVGCLR